MANTANIAIRPFTTTTNALTVFKKQPAHKRALKKAKGLFRRKPKSVKKSAQELGRSVAHAVTTAHPAVQVLVLAGTATAVGYPTVRLAQAKTQQLGLEGQTVMVKPSNGDAGTIGEIVSAGRTTDPLGRECLVVVDDDGQVHSFAMNECTIVDLHDKELDKAAIRKNARGAVPFGDSRELYKSAQRNRKELTGLKPVFTAAIIDASSAKKKAAS
jgi:hypothetical protein